MLPELAEVPTPLENTLPGRKLRFRGFTELASLPTEPDWLWRGYLARGSLTMLAGHPFRGKSMLVTGLMRALETGASFVGQPTRAATSLLVTEEDESQLRPRAERFGILHSKSEFLGRSDGVFSLDWERLIESATERALAQRHGLLIIDTFAGLAGLADEQENDSGAIVSRLRPLQAAAGKGLAVLFLHHLNSGGHPRGSKAFSSVVDISVRLLRSSGSSTLELDRMSRFPIDGNPRQRATLIQAPDCWFYHPVGKLPSTPSPREGVTTDALIVEALQAAGEQGLSYSDFDRIAGLSSHKAKKRLPTWYPGRVERHGRGTKTDPYRWFAAIPA